MNKLSILLVFTCTTLALGQARQPAPVPTTQQASVSALAFSPTDPAVTPELAKASQTKMVSIKVEKKPVLEVLADISKQTGYDIRPGYDGMFSPRQRGGNVTLTLANQPFWYVIREVGVRGNINMYNNSGDGGNRAVMIQPGQWGSYGSLKAAASIKGPFMVILANLDRVNTVNMAKPQEVDRKIQIGILTFVEPSVAITQMSYDAVIEEAVDDKGNSMIPPPRDQHVGRNMQNNEGISWQSNFQIPYPTTNPGTRIAKLKGHIPAVLQLASAPMEIVDPLKAGETAKTLGTRKVTFKSFKKDDQGYVTEIAFHRGDTEPQRFHELFNETIGLKLTDAAGKAYSFHNSGGSSSGEELTRTFRFQSHGGPGQKPGDPVKLVIEIPTGTQEIGVPFELVNLPLP